MVKWFCPAGTSIGNPLGQLEIAGEGMNFGGTMAFQGIPVTMVKAEPAVGLSHSAGFVLRQ